MTHDCMAIRTMRTAITSIGACHANQVHTRTIVTPKCSHSLWVIIDPCFDQMRMLWLMLRATPISTIFIYL